MNDGKTATEQLICNVFKTRRYPDMYLYVIREDGLDRVPELLLERFDDPELALSFKLTPSRKLAIADATTVFNALVVDGYYLQMPPVTSVPAERP